MNFTAYTIDKNSPFYRFVSLEGGVNYTSSNGESDLWVEYKRNQSNQAINFADGFPDGNAIINQASISGYVGVRLSQFINTCISGKAESTSFKGVKKELWDIRFGLKPLIFAFAPDINYTYNIYENFETTSHQEYAQVPCKTHDNPNIPLFSFFFFTNKQGYAQALCKITKKN